MGAYENTLEHIDIFDVLTAISKRKMAFMRNGMNEREAIEKAVLLTYS
jgi:hypothetical protein